MRIYLLTQLIDNCAWVTLEAFKNEEKAKEKLKQIKRENMVNSWMCRYVYDIKEVNLK